MIFCLVVGVMSVMSIVGMIASSSATKDVADNTVFVIDLNGQLQERAEDDIMAVLSGIEFDKYGEALGEILTQLDAVRAGDISEAELAAARRTVANELRAGADSPNYLADFYLRETVQGTDASPDDIAALAETVTAEDVAAVARGVELDAVYVLRGEEAGTE